MKRENLSPVRSLLEEMDKLNHATRDHPQREGVISYANVNLPCSKDLVLQHINARLEVVKKSLAEFGMEI